jgi:predicted metal-dependent hydrolase
VDYTLKIDRKLKNIYIKIDDDCNIVVKSPNKIKALEFLDKKQAWCEKKVQRCQEKKALQPTFTEGSTILYLGESYKLLLKPANKNSIALQGDTMVIEHNERVDFNRLLDRFYQQEAESEIPKLVEYWSNKMQLFPTKISFGKAKKRLGSCNHKNNLRFNTHLMRLKIEQIEYVVIHELAHIKHKNHSKSFWQEVARYLPDYKAIDKSIGDIF